MVAPYIAMRTLPIGFNLRVFSSIANSVINSEVSLIKLSFKSPVFNQGIIPF